MSSFQRRHGKSRGKSFWRFLRICASQVFPLMPKPDGRSGDKKRELSRLHTHRAGPMRALGTREKKERPA